MKRQVIFGVVAILSIVIVVFGVSQDFRKKRELAEAAARTRAYAVDETMLQKWSAVLPDTAKSYNELKDSFDNGNRVKTASEIQTPILLLFRGTVDTDDKHVSATAADGFSFARSDSIHFTQDPSEAKTILYVTSQVFGEYPFSLYRVYATYALSPDGPACLPLYEARGRNSCMLKIDYSDSNAENDEDFFDYLQMWFKLKENVTDDVNAAMKAVTAKVWLEQKVEEAAGGLLFKAYQILQQSELPEEKNILLHPEAEPDNVLAYWYIGIDNTPDERIFKRDDPSPWPYARASYPEWKELAYASYYHAETGGEIAIEPGEQPSSIAVVGERVCALELGSYVKLGTVYAYRERHTIIDLETEEVLCWVEGHTTPGNYERGLTMYGDDIDKSYPVDAHGRRIASHGDIWHFEYGSLHPKLDYDALSRNVLNQE